MTGPTPTRFHDLHIIAEILNVTTTHHNGGTKGHYDHATRTISTRRGLTTHQYRSTLAHELGHAAYQDTPTSHGHFRMKQEHRADRFAARLLIEPDELEAACAFYGHNLPAIADELEVTTHLLTIYLTLNKETA